MSESESTIKETIRAIGCRTWGLVWLMAVIWIILAAVARYGHVKVLTFFYDYLVAFFIAYVSWRVIVYFAGGRKPCDHGELFADKK